MYPTRHSESHSHSGQSHYKSNIPVTDHCDISRLQEFSWGLVDPLDYIPLQPEPRHRELVTVPTVTDFDDDLETGNNHTLSSTISHRITNKKRKIGNRRTGDRSYSNKRVMLQSDKCTLEVRRIPASLNTMENLLSHFSKFGTIVNLQLCPDGDSEAALVQFENPNEATNAFRSTEAVLNNRFIRVFWHRKEKDQPKQYQHQQQQQQQQQQHHHHQQQQHSVTGGFGSGSQQKSDDYNVYDVRKFNSHPVSNENYDRSARISVKERLGNRLGDHRKVIKRNESVSLDTCDQPTLPKSKQVSEVSHTHQSDVTCSENSTPNKTENDLNKDNKLYQNMELQKKRHAMLHKVLELQKKRQEILLSYMKQQKLLVEKLGKAKTEKEKNEIKSTVDTLSEQIKVLKEEISKDSQSILNESAKLSTTDKKNKLQVEKELLDAELDFYNKLHKGETSAELSKKLHELKLRAKFLGVTNSRSPRFMKRFATMRGALRGRKLRPSHILNNNYEKNRKVDRRTRKVLVEDVNEEDNIDLLSHISQYAEVETIDPSTQGLIVTFKTRHDAEVGMRQISSAKYKEHQGLKCSWFMENKVKKDSVDTDNTKSANGDDKEMSTETVEDDKKSSDDSKNDDVIFDTADLLYEEDDDDDDEDESRAWRR